MNFLKKEYTFEERLAILNFIVDGSWLLSTFYQVIILSELLGVTSIGVSTYMFARALFKTKNVK